MELNRRSIIRKTFTFFGCAAIVAGSVLWWGARTAPATFDDSDPLPLQIPLAKTKGARADFITEYKAHVGYKLRPLYEKWIDIIGANGIHVSLSEVDPGCHDEAHDFGKVIYSRVKDVGLSLRACEDTCNSGCMHGVLMETFAGVVPADADDDHHIALHDIKGKLDSICDRSSITDLYLPGDCAHGVGHAIMFLSGYITENAVKTCEGFSDSHMQYYCATGAYMEYMNEYPAKLQKNLLAMLSPCDTSPYPAACFRYRMVGAVNLHYTHGGTWPQVVATCLALKGNVQVGCFHGIGNSHLSFVLAGKTNVGELCSQGSRDDQESCVIGLMERMAKYHPKEAAKQCAFADDWKKEVCTAAVARKMYDLQSPLSLFKR